MLLKICFLIVIIKAEFLSREHTTVEQHIASADTAEKAYLRTTTIVEQRTELGRLVLIVVSKKLPEIALLDSSMGS
ncbi:hypothetical protein KIN20_032493 [Parelaphostrongylus tenuis]|uniref:Uncharacterized protein n=1 Tax=Parelaphostrongylus tenuis TaxID=148309 RepID=A0AAD5WII8_PARTN|nr:hypothetical protein KIN20_032493 [Parelaphostrongylus tenuis]